MRVALVQPGLDHKGGAENVVVWLAEGLCARGHDVVLATERFSPELYAERLRGVRLELPPDSSGPARLRSRAAARWARAAWLARVLGGCDWVVANNAPTSWWAGTARRFRGLRARVAWLCHEPPRALHFAATDPHCQSWRSFAPAGVDNPHLDALARARCRLRPRRARRMVRDRRRDVAAVRRCDLVAANSAFTARNVHAIYGVDPAVCHVGVPLPDAARPTAGGYVGFVASASPLKNGENVLRAVRELTREPRHRDLRVEVVGDVSATAGLRRQVAESGLAGHVGFRGPLGDGELSGFYRDARCLAYCPIDEPFGLVPVEALACATPAVVSDHGGPAEVIADGSTGLHANSLDPASIAAALGRLWRDPDLAMRLGAAGRAEVAKHFCVDAMVERLLGLLSR